ERRRPRFCEGSGDDETFLLAGGRARHIARRRNLRRLRLHQGLPSRKILARLQDRQDLRGHQQHAVANYRQAGAGQVARAALRFSLSRWSPIGRRTSEPPTQILAARLAEPKTADIFLSCPSTS